tara:strand:- start:1033 stop:1275 length:243 start_codon:yes stop_codon:yes gene_type:complete
VDGALSFYRRGGTMKKKDINKFDWRKSPARGFPYTGDVDNKKYLKDRSELFAKSGNGWWWYQGTAYGKFIGKDINAEQKS